ncbi:Fe-S cluster assembly protein SufB [Blattabacterium cuenoti]|uniref:FeS cluster assembly protein SufB n=1 Tax=Blattabacterium sp. (Anaplecta sp.) TaxID=2712790 RepID=A0A6G6BNH7_9FLAO|nr:Fe-S cluster assembly protein SufB [Blattabacterium cuenoti]QID53771.1 feS cluster assembly protein SufB [Blattabacterium sp. (Anaplecta sp.)]
MIKKNKSLENFIHSEYKYGFYTPIESEKIPKGLNVETIKTISKKKNEPKWILDWRLESYSKWKKMKIPRWSNITYNIPDFNNIIYFSAPKTKLTINDELKNINTDTTELSQTFDKLGVYTNKKSHYVATDFVLDSVSLTTTYQDKLLQENGIIFCSINEAITKYPNLVQKYFGSVVGQQDNFYASLNSAVFSDGSFCYIPKGVRCPMELSTYFRINESGTGQFERTLIVADTGSYVSYLEGCTATQRKENQLHAAVVEIVALDKAEVKYSTVQNWYPGNKQGVGGVLNFVTKRGLCEKMAKISWIQVETGSSITWKYPSCILKGDGSIGEFYSLSMTKNFQQADTGSKMIHLGNGTKSVIISKGISSGNAQNNYRGLVKISDKAKNSRNFSQCDSLLIGNKCGAHTFPSIDVNNSTSKVEHEATTSKIGENQIFYCNQRGIGKDKAISIIVNGFSNDILNKLPMEFSIEAKKLVEISLEGTIG